MTLHHIEGATCPLCEDKLMGAHAYLQDWFRRKKTEYTNLHIAWAYRDFADQEQAFADKKSNAHWPLSPHNHTEQSKPCSLALDLFLIDEDFEARFPILFYSKLNAENIANRDLVIWGGNFKHLKDDDHFEYSGSI